MYNIVCYIMSILYVTTNSSNTGIQQCSHSYIFLRDLRKYLNIRKLKASKRGFLQKKKKKTCANNTIETTVFSVFSDVNHRPVCTIDAFVGRMINASGHDRTRAIMHRVLKHENNKKKKL